LIKKFVISTSAEQKIKQVELEQLVLFPHIFKPVEINKLWKYVITPPYFVIPSKYIRRG